MLDIIILDDASPDGTAAIISGELAKHRDRIDVRFIQNDENLGAFGNTRKGLSMTEGDFIILFNGDDVMLPTLVEQMVRVWREHDVSLVTGNARYIDESGVELNRFFRDPTEPSDETFETLARHCSNAVCFGAAMGFERTLYDQFGYPPEYLTAEDVMLPFYAYLCKGARFIPEPLLKYRVHDQNTSMTLQFERTTNPVDKLTVWAEDRYIHLAHGVRMISELERLGQSDPGRYGDIEQRIRPLLSALVLERARQMVEARGELHDLGLPAHQRTDTRTPLTPLQSAPTWRPTMKLFVAIYDDVRLLNPFLRHYKNAGITQFYIASAPEYADILKQYAGDYEIFMFENLNVADSMSGGTLAVSEMRRLHQQDAEWVVIVDLDEFIEFDQRIEQIVSTADEEGANVVRGIMYDRFARSGELVDFEPNANLSKSYPVKSRFIRDVMQGTDFKGVLVKGKLRSVPGGGHHGFEGERVFSRALEISHYKWNSTAIIRLKRAHEALVAIRNPWAVEYRRAIEHYERHGRFAWEEFGGELVEC